jgi:hypothetical protein
MAAPGYSITELIHTIRAARKVYGSFVDEFGNATARIAELDNTLQFLENTLGDINVIKSYYGIVFTGEENLRRKLLETNAFIDKYVELKPGVASNIDGSGGQHWIRRSLRATWQTVCYAFDTDAEKINAGLQLEMQKLNMWILVKAW